MRSVLSYTDSSALRNFLHQPAYVKKLQDILPIGCDMVFVRSKPRENFRLDLELSGSADSATVYTNRVAVLDRPATFQRRPWMSAATASGCPSDSRVASIITEECRTPSWKS